MIGLGIGIGVVATLMIVAGTHKRMQLQKVTVRNNRRR